MSKTGFVYLLGDWEKECSYKIGVTTGKIENRIKIIKSTSLGNMAWDESNKNNWARPSTLNTYFNNILHIH